MRLLTTLIAVVAMAGCGDTGLVDSENRPPVANAGPDQMLDLPMSITLDGSQSSDPDGDALSYRWTIIERPTGSSADLSTSSTIDPMLDADLPGEYFVTLVVNDGELDSPADTVTHFVGMPPSITVFSRTIGAGLQFPGVAVLETGDHGGVTVTVSSSDPAVALVSPDPGTAGSASFDVVVPDGESSVDIVAQGVLGASGSASLDVSAPGFASTSGALSVIPGQIWLSNLDSVQTVGTNQTFFVQLGLSDGTGPGTTSIQGASAANDPPLELTVAVGESDVADLVGVSGTGDRLSETLKGGDFQPSFTFVPTASGSTSVSAEIPGFELVDGPAQVQVGSPGIVGFNRTIGAGLQFSSSAQLHIPDHGGIILRLESSDPEVARVSDSPDNPGSAAVEIAVPNGQDQVEYTVQGVAGASGSVTITASSEGFSDGFSSVDIVPSTLRIGSLDSPTSVGVQQTLVVILGPSNEDGSLNGFQGVSAGNDPQLVLSVLSSNEDIGQFTFDNETGSSLDIPLDPGDFQLNVSFLALAPGATTISTTIPGFIQSEINTANVTVTAPEIALFDRSVGSGLQFSGNGSLAVSDHGGVTVRIESGDPATALVAPDGVTAGSEAIEVFVPDGQSALPYVVQGVLDRTGDAVITASASGFADGTGDVSVYQSAVGLASAPDTLSVGEKDSFSIFLGRPNEQNSALRDLQRVSAAVAPLLVTVSSSNGSIARAEKDGFSGAVVETQLPADTFQFDFSLEGVAPGEIRLTAVVPGFITTSSADITVVVIR